MRKLEVALRTNRQKTLWPTFQRKFKDGTEICLNFNQIVDVEAGSDFADKLTSFVTENRGKELVTSLNEQDEQVTEAFVGRFSSLWGSGSGWLYLSNSELFVVEINSQVFASCWKKILRFDGDTIAFSMPTLQYGIAIDLYQSEISNDWKFSIDCW
jgi:hypothetical protein